MAMFETCQHDVIANHGLELLSCYLKATMKSSLIDMCDVDVKITFERVQQIVAIAITRFAKNPYNLQVFFDLGGTSSTLRLLQLTKA
jgi:hypothetical protein